MSEGDFHASVFNGVDASPFSDVPRDTEAFSEPDAESRDPLLRRIACFRERDSHFGDAILRSFLDINHPPPGAESYADDPLIIAVIEARQRAGRQNR